MSERVGGRDLWFRAWRMREWARLLVNGCWKALEGTLGAQARQQLLFIPSACQKRDKRMRDTATHVQAMSCLF